MKIFYELYILMIFLVLAGFWNCTGLIDEAIKKKKVHAQIQVLPGYQVEVAAGPELVDYPMFATLDETGRLFVFESIGNVYTNSQAAIDTPQFRIKLLEDQDADGTYDKVTIFADSLSFPQGGIFYKGSLYASSAPDLIKLTDQDGDGIADEKEIILSGWILNVNANSLIGPMMGPDGWLYFTSAIMGFDVTTKEGEQLKGETARIWRVRPDGSDLEWISAGGMNNPVEVTFAPSGEVIGTQTFFVHPQRGLRDALTYWVEGGVYGKKTREIDRDQLPLTGELMPVVSQYSRVAPSGIGLYRNTLLGEDFKDNLFSAQFNTHSVIRHQLIRAGGSFRTVDSPFLWSENDDFHPTDVLEDGDGSLLVVETGGWFIKGCPLSQVSKPQLKGAIYRIRHDGSPKIQDPFGNQILWSTLDLQAIIQLLDDRRPFVVDRAIEALIDRGEAAIDLLADQISNAPAVSTRTRSVFALYRIGSKAALAVIRQALEDPEEEISIAAARSLGLARDLASLDVLTDQLKKEHAAVKRQAATALGQLGSTRSVTPLLLAAQDEDDRFVQHAIVYSLVLINEPQLIEGGLSHHNSQVRQVALTALDQISNSTLRFDHLVPFLESEDQTLQQTGLWVASHHPRWSSEMIVYLRPKISSAYSDEKIRKMAATVLMEFCENPEMQRFIIDEFKTGNDAQKIFLLEIMSDCQVSSFPEVWTKTMMAELPATQSGEIKSRLIDLIRFRRLQSFTDLLINEANDAQNAATIKVKAIETLLESNEQILENHFSYLFAELQTTSDVQLRQQIASTLGGTQLSEKQIREITQSYLPKADHFILPRLLPLFRQSQDIEVGQELIKVLSKSSGLASFSEAQIRSYFVDYPAEIKPDLESLVTKINDVRSDRLERLKEIEEKIEYGDEGRGRLLYFEKATCWTCHAVGEEGGDLGPDLTSIQKDRSTHDILEAILYPSVSFVRDYETYEVITQSGRYTGIIKEQSPEAIVLAMAPQASIRIERNQIIKMEPNDVSLMPSGLGELLTDAELVDLLSFLLGDDLNY